MRRGMCALFVGLAIGGASLPASAQEPTQFAKHGEWIIEKHAPDPEGLAYPHCAAERFFGTENGIRITLGYPQRDKDGVLGIEFVGEGSAAGAQSFSVSYHFGDPSGATSGTAKAAPPDGYFMRIEEDEGPGSFDGLANGEVLVIETRASEWRYDLSGSNPAMSSLLECAQGPAGTATETSGRPRETASAPREPAAAAPPPPTSPRPAPAPSRQEPSRQAAACPAPGSVRSERGGEAATVVFINRSGRAQDVYWLDSDGQRKHYVTLQPGDRHRQKTSSGHAWLVVDANGACQPVHRAAPGRHRHLIR